MHSSISGKVKLNILKNAEKKNTKHVEESRNYSDKMYDFIRVNK